MSMRAVSLVVLSIVVGCGSGDDGGDPGSDPDAMVTGPQNGLGTTCVTADECPSDPAHACVFLNSGNPNLGYCSPVCSSDVDCTANYSGPGTPTCFVPDQPNRCSITCTGQCPGDLVCADLGGGAVQICVTE